MNENATATLPKPPKPLKPKAAALDSLEYHPQAEARPLAPSKTRIIHSRGCRNLNKSVISLDLIELHRRSDRDRTLAANRHPSQYSPLGRIEIRSGMQGAPVVPD
jgi:hypothetical protein